MTREVSRKALFVGEVLFVAPEAETTLTCVGWNSLEQIGNPRDFDVIILDVPRDGTVGNDNLVRFAKLFDVTTMVDLLVSRCQIYVLGDPRLTVPWALGPRVLPGPLADLAGIGTAWLKESGERLKVESQIEASHLRLYLESIRSYSYSLESWSPNESIQTAFSSRAVGELAGRKLSVDVRKLLSSRAGHGIAFQVLFSAKNQQGQVSVLGGKVEFVPQVENPQYDESRRLVELVIGIPLGAVAPTWLTSIVVEGEERLSVAEESLLSSRREVDERLEKLRLERMKAREVLGLLFESGPALERIVRESFADLGATIQESSEPGKEDGWLTVEIDGVSLSGVLEIGGTKGESHSESRIRQLLAWVTRSIEINGAASKGIFVGNSSNTTEPASRKPPFSDSWTRTAKHWGFCAIRAEDLLEAVMADRAGKLDRTAFWRAISKTAGPISRADLIRPKKSVGRRRKSRQE